MGSPNMPGSTRWTGYDRPDRRWLLAQQQPRHCWNSYSEHWRGRPTATTAYIAWALIEAGYRTRRKGAGDGLHPRVAGGRGCLRPGPIANALAAYAPMMVDTAVLGKAVQVADRRAYGLLAERQHRLGRDRPPGSVETTARGKPPLCGPAAYPRLLAARWRLSSRSKDSWGT